MASEVVEKEKKTGGGSSFQKNETRQKKMTFIQVQVRMMKLFSMIRGLKDIALGF